MSEFMEAFIDDMREHLDNINVCLLSLEKNPTDKALINELFRSFHTMKSVTATMDFAKTSELIHRMEDLLYGVREDKFLLDFKMIELIFIFHDYLESAMDTFVNTESEATLSGDHIKDILDTILKNLQAPERESAKKTVARVCFGKKELTFMQNRIKEGQEASMIKIRIADECVFKSLRIWMAIAEIEKLGTIVLSFPQKPDESEFLQEDFFFQTSVLRVVLASKLRNEEIYRTLKNSDNEFSGLSVESTNVQELKDVCLEDISEIGNVFNSEFKMSNGKMDPNVTEILEDKKIITAAIQKFSILYEEQIIEKLKDMQGELVMYESDHGKLEYVKKMMRNLHTIKGLCGFIGNYVMFDFIKVIEEYLDMLINGKSKGGQSLVDLLVDSYSLLLKMANNSDLIYRPIFREDIEKLQLQIREQMKQGNVEFDSQAQSDGGTIKRIGQIMIDEGKISNKDVDDILKKQKEIYKDLRFGQVAIKEEKADIKDVIASIRKQDQIQIKQEESRQQENRLEQAKRETGGGSFLKISSDKVDNLVEQLGELMILHSLHKQEIKDLSNGKDLILNSLTRIERITKSLQEVSIALRMLPLKSTFQKLQRVARDTAVELGKKVEVTISGEDTEIDRVVADKIFEPLMHIVRNSVSHGLEEEAEREEKGKSAIGIIKINAYNKRGNLYIEISDDGRGLSREKLLMKAIERGLAKADTNYTDSEVYRLVFLAGVSTQEEINNISGRGVGMNVVETEISRLRGKTEITNQEGKGCCFTIKLPVNMTTMNGTIVDIFGENYILPTLSIREFFKPTSEQWVSVINKRKMVRIRGETVDLVNLHGLLGYEDKLNLLEDSMVIILEMDQNYLALPVKGVVGKQEVVVKSLGDEFKNINYAAGATILGDGRISIILDIEHVFKSSGDME